MGPCLIICACVGRCETVLLSGHLAQVEARNLEDGGRVALELPLSEVVGGADLNCAALSQCVDYAIKLKKAKRFRGKVGAGVDQRKPLHRYHMAVAHEHIQCAETDLVKAGFISHTHAAMTHRPDAL